MSLLLAYYADDFTGSTDALEFLTRAGGRAMLFIEPPTKEQLSRYGDLNAIGIAGMTRSMTPEKMDRTLRKDFEALRKLGPSHVHYKVCSTFDSSPEIGSIGRAIDVGASVFENRITPVVVGAPQLGRYVVFGNLFARMGIGSEGAIHRLDRHPSISHHPVTPMTEADLRTHLSKQTARKVGLVDLVDLEGSETELASAISRQAEQGSEVVVFDTHNERHLAAIGRALDGQSQEGPLFTVGSSGVEVALGKEWQRGDAFAARDDFPLVEAVEALLVISGSCSPVTEEQIEWALENGFREVALDTSLLVDPEGRSREIERVVGLVSSYLESGDSVIAHSARGPHDPRLDATKRAFSAVGILPEELKERSAEFFGGALGEVARQCVENSGIRRLLIAGGDSSSYAARAMGIEAVEMISPLSPGAPLCRAFAPGSPLHEVEINFKGGQVGGMNYFEVIAKGQV